MLTKIKKKLPLFFENYLRYRWSIILYKKDTKFLLKSKKNRKYRKEQLLRGITEYYHAIEKGLIKREFRQGFGENALRGLLKNLKYFKNEGFDIQNIRFRTGIGVLQSYIEKHHNTTTDTSWIELEMSGIVDNIFEDLGGVKKIIRISFDEGMLLPFNQLVERRVSVRDFGKKPIKDKLVNRALELSMRTPSVCNRQGWFVRVVKNKELIKDVLELQGGFKGHGENISHLILVTSLNNYFRYPSERHQGHVDGGMFSMSLMYSLTSLGIASCPLNSNFPTIERRKINKLLEIDNSESLIMFIAIGSYPNDAWTTKSIRDNFLSKTHFFN